MTQSNSEDYKKVEELDFVSHSRIFTIVRVYVHVIKYGLEKVIKANSMSLLELITEKTDSEPDMRLVKTLL